VNRKEWCLSSVAELAPWLNRFATIPGLEPCTDSTVRHGGVKVNLVLKDALKPNIGWHILSEAVYA